MSQCQRHSYYWYWNTCLGWHKSDYDFRWPKCKRTPTQRNQIVPLVYVLVEYFDNLCVQQNALCQHPAKYTQEQVVQYCCHCGTQPLCKVNKKLIPIHLHLISYVIHYLIQACICKYILLYMLMLTLICVAVSMPTMNTIRASSRAENMLKWT